MSCHNPPNVPCEDLGSGTDSDSSQQPVPCAISSFNPPKSKAGIIIALTLQMGKLQHRAVKYFVQGHTAS